MIRLYGSAALYACAAIAGLACCARAFHAPPPALTRARYSSRTLRGRSHDTRRMFNMPAVEARRGSGTTSSSWGVHRGDRVAGSGRRRFAADGSDSSDPGARDNFYTPADLDAYSEPWGISLRYKGTLNTYRIEAYRDNGELAGYTTGFYLGDLLHLDKVQIQRRASAYEPGAPNAPAPGTRDLPWAEKTGNIFQLGAVLGCAAVRYGKDRGAKRIELLAIRENEEQHRRIVRYYRIAGFRVDREVGEDLGSFKDRLLWGAEGTLMVANVDDFMNKWTPLMLDSKGITANVAQM